MTVQLAPLRRRVRVALAVLRRVQTQRDRYATAYGQATTAQQRFAATANALRAAAASGSHQHQPDEVARRLDRVTDQMARLLSELLDAQQAKANRTLRADRRRIERNERRRIERDRHSRIRQQPESA